MPRASVGPYTTRSTRWVAVILGLLLMVGLGCTSASERTDIAPPEAVAVSESTLNRLARAWATGDEAVAAALADPQDVGARELLAIPARNVSALGLRDVALDLLASGLARVSWRTPSPDSDLSRVDLVIRATEQGLVLEPTTDSPAPLWLTEPRMVRRGTGSVMVLGAPEHDLARILSDARRARRDVRRAWPTWDGRLVVEVASSQQRLAAALGRPAAAYDGIAAATSSSDGTRGATTPVHVFVNPLVYAGMSAPAARIVMTHEVVHVATRAPVTSVPLWWAEGVAEYVGFAAVTAQVGRRLESAATQDLLARVARRGPPRRLPGTSAFAGPGRDAAYASARLAVTVLADLGGRSDGSSPLALSRFQALLAAGTDVDQALRGVFGIDRDAFVRRWRAELVRLTTGR
jgi:hypothetical protein